MAKTKAKKLSQLLNESGYKTYNMVIDDNRIDLSVHNYVLTRKDDNKQIPCSVVKFVEWGDNDKATAIHDTPAIGRSIVLDPHGYGQYRWLTTEIVEIISDTEFKTKNSTYTLHKV